MRANNISGVVGSFSVEIQERKRKKKKGRAGGFYTEENIDDKNDNEIKFWKEQGG